MRAKHWILALLPLAALLLWELVPGRSLEASQRLPSYSPEEIVEFFSVDGVAADDESAPQLHLDIKFAFDSAELTRDAQLDLDAVGRALSDSRLSGRRFQLGGHTDDIGDEFYNLGLSQRRAVAARDYLVEHWDVDPDRLASVGYGESDPIAPGRTRESRAKNRRVTLGFARR